MNFKEFTETHLTEISKTIRPKWFKDIMSFLKQNYSGRYNGKLASDLCKG